MVLLIGDILACPVHRLLLPWIPLLAASMNPEETPLFRKELTGETHKAEGERVRGREEWKKWGVKEDKKFWDTTWVHGEPMRIAKEKTGRELEG